MQKQTSTSLSLLLSLVLLIVTMGVSPVAAQQEPAESYDELVARQAMTASFTAAVAEGNVDYAKQQLVADMQAFINAHSMDEMQARQYMIDNVIRMGSETTPYEEVSPDMFPAAAAISKSGQDIVTNWLSDEWLSSSRCSSLYGQCSARYTSQTRSQAAVLVLGVAGCAALTVGTALAFCLAGAAVANSLNQGAASSDFQACDYGVQGMGCHTRSELALEASTR